MGAADEHTFLFADLAGYTALTEAHGDEQSAQLTNEFFDAVRELLPDHDAELIKTIGDAVMVRLADPRDAVRLGVEIVEEVGKRHGVPSVRVGMHTGPATTHDGDWFGAAVNIAARVSGVAGGCEVLVTEATRASAGDLHGVELTARGSSALKNVQQPVAIYAVRRQGPRSGELPIDPVCRMAVDPDRAAARIAHGGREHYFCSFRCAEAFAAAPERYAPGLRASLRPRLDAAAGFLQGASYIGLGIWSLTARDHYRRVHAIERDDWILNAHGGWLLAVGTTLMTAALRRRTSSPEVRTLGVASALALAANDAASRNRVPGIYRRDLMYELAVATTWLLGALQDARQDG